MRVSLGLVIFLIVMGIKSATSDPPATRIYVRSVPPGAKVVIDGKEVGVSDGLFVVVPGSHSVLLELDGYATEKRDVHVPGERITRLVVTLVREDRAGGGPSERGTDAALKAVETVLGTTPMPHGLSDAIRTVVRQHPTETRWSGRVGETLFALAAKALPVGDVRSRALPAILELVRMLAVQELLKAKCLLDRYGEYGLNDATTLRQAVVEAAGELGVTGSVKGLTHHAVVQGDFAVAYVFAEEHSLTAHLLDPAEVVKVQEAYRNVMHRKARELMERANWNDALLLWRHLHSRKLVSDALYLDAATCFRELKQPDEALRILQEAYEAFAGTASAEWVEKCGDAACQLGPKGEALGLKAYTKASERMKSSVSEAQKPVRKDL